MKLLALFALCLSMTSCSWFNKHPVIPAVVTCSGETIPIALVTQTYNDIMSEDWLDLATNVVPLLKDGYADLQCIWNYLGVSNPETLPHIQSLKAKHADAFKGSVSLRSPGDSTPKQGPTATKISENTGHGAGQGGDQPPHAHALAPEREGVQRVNHPAVSFGYVGPSPGAELARCTAACGSSNAIAPPDGCRCLRGRGRDARWIPLRERAGAGMVASR